VVHHDACADPRGLFVDLAPHRGHHPAWLVAGNDRARELAKPKRRGFSAGRARRRRHGARAPDLEIRRLAICVRPKSSIAFS
jgi:hypothetical protein